MIATAILALGLVLIVEGLVYALAPSLIEDLLETLKTLSHDKRRTFGVLSVALGVILLLASRLL